jgi:predicted Ser/Thr protein kinase
MKSRSSRALLSPDDQMGNYTVVGLLDRGGFGDIYSVTCLGSDIRFAMKVEPTSGRRQYLANETSIIKELPPAPFFSRLVAAGATESHRFLVPEFLGPSLDATQRRSRGHRFSLATVSFVFHVSVFA